MDWEIFNRALSTNLKTQISYFFQWDGSSVGEHTAEDRGVEGSIPSRPIVRTREVEGENLRANFSTIFIMLKNFSVKFEQIPSRPIVRRHFY